MKTYKLIYWVLTSILMLTFSCSKEKFETDHNSDELGIGLTVDIGGISEEFETLASVSNSVQMKTDESPDLTKLVSFNDFDAIPSVKDLTPNSSAKLSKLSNNKFAAQTPMSNGVKYYLVLFENETKIINNDSVDVIGEFKGAYLLTAGVRKTINVEVDKKYHWKAYSYNSDADDLPSVSSSNLNVSMGENKDFIYASGITNKISATNPTFLSIIFNRMLARVGIEINAQGMFTDDITTLDADLILRKDTTISGSATVIETPFKIANFNLKDNKITESTTNYSTNNFKLFSISKNIPVDSNAKSNKVIAYLNIPPYVKDNINIGVRLNKLKIELDQEAKTILGENKNYREFDYLNLSEQNPPIIYSENINILSSGKQKLLKVDLVESPLIVNSPDGEYSILALEGLIPGLKLFSRDIPGIQIRWARSNLYFNNTDKSYRFHHVNNKYNERNTFFTYNAVDPTDWKIVGDPCRLVYPENLWRKPTSEEFYATVGGSTSNINLLGLLNIQLNLEILGLSQVEFPGVSTQNFTTSYAEYIPQGGDSRFYDVGTDKTRNNTLRFYYNGYLLRTDLIENLFSLKIAQPNDIARVWTYDNNINLLNLVNVGAVAYSGLSAGDYIDASLVNLLNIDALGIDVLQTDANNIRCVRNTQYTRKNNN